MQVLEIILERIEKLEKFITTETFSFIPVLWIIT